MAVRIRLRRMGAKKSPTYRLVVADSRSPRDGRFIEEIGFYNPTTDPADIKVEEEKAIRWLSQGAKPSETVRYLLTSTGVLQKYEEIKKGQ
ncbi:MAG: 30S ribosomal protein S16 [Firmicutes bacterium]|nr:30S ribosomal protein S16 [Bacillota bacterium]